MDLKKIMNSFEEEHKRIEKELTKQEILSDSNKLSSLSKKHSELSEIIEKYNEIKKLKNDLAEWKTMKTNAEQDEIEEIEFYISDVEKNIEKKEIELKILLVPDINDDKNIIIEIRAGTGGEEAALFAASLFRMYTRFAERNNWKIDLIEENGTEIGGFKEVIFEIKGKGVYSKMKFESGGHRVQRVPVTESGGRIHTSAATVAIMPEISDVDFEIDPKDLRIDTYRSGGAGGQHVNKTDSAVRIVHLPTGTTVAVQKERSQHQNKAKAMEILRAKLYDLYNDKQTNEITENRRIQVGSGDRSEKIRTYNYPQSRVTDHRIKFTSYRLNEILDGDLDEIVMKLAEADINSKLEKLHKELIKGE
ncbi:MAG: peptide chain release factor 1 [Kosmotogales bacterium]|nr:peptide chain release factor 1 [Kosmotogales bacterium]